jgi:hypothetical protein
MEHTLERHKIHTAPGANLETIRELGERGARHKQENNILIVFLYHFSYGLPAKRM